MLRERCPCRTCGAVVVAVLALAACTAAEPASRDELCAAVHQVVLRADNLPAQLATADAAARRTTSYDFGEDVESAREIAARQASRDRRARALPLLAAGDDATLVLRGGTRDSAPALRRVSATGTALLDQLRC